MTDTRLANRVRAILAEARRSPANKNGYRSLIDAVAAETYRRQYHYTPANRQVLAEARAQLNALNRAGWRAGARNYVPVFAPIAGRQVVRNYNRQPVQVYQPGYRPNYRPPRDYSGRFVPPPREARRPPRNAGRFVPPARETRKRSFFGRLFR